MALTRSFRETVARRAKHDPEFKAALLQEAVQALFEGDLVEARMLFRDCINATIGFEALSVETNLPVKSLMRMVGPNGNPRLDNFVLVVGALQRRTHMRAHVEIDGYAGAYGDTADAVSACVEG